MAKADDDIPTELRGLVRVVLAQLGRAIETEYGAKTFKLVESIRQQLKQTRSQSLELRLAHRQKLLGAIEKLSAQERFRMVHSFAVSLELINASENAFRSFRLEHRDLSTDIIGEEVTFVLTAHPTESRSAECVALFTQITKDLIRVLEGETDLLANSLHHKIVLALKITLARNQRPEVGDEATYIYSIILKKEIIETLLRLSVDEQKVFIRTWVGGDKDGHPGINANVMQQSLQLSRTRLCELTGGYLRETRADLMLIRSVAETKKLERWIDSLERQVQKMTRLAASDGKKVTRFHKDAAKLIKTYTKQMGVGSPALDHLTKLLLAFPALVVPLELREGSALIHHALKDKNEKIYRMLKRLARLSSGCSPRWYAWSFVISQTESAADIVAATKLIETTLGAFALPVVPLFESRHALQNSEEIVRTFFYSKKILKNCRRFWGGRFEVMVGYSDSSKENGALSSRVLIEEALFTLEKTIKTLKLIPIFFHGSGGSVERGGGSLEGQIAWWPESARKHYKATIQGEMIYRSFATPQIMSRQINKILTGAKLRSKYRKSSETSAAIRKFSEQVSEHYRAFVHDRNSLKIVELATPYSYLDLLKIGSRPAKRNTKLSVESLRAIPWVLCWTQIRSLLPIWWGIGTAWQNSSREERATLKTAFESDPLFGSFVKLLCFTLAKVDLSIWFTYLRTSKLPRGEADQAIKLYTGEFNRTLQCVQDLTGQQSLLWFRPWLETSIELRSTMIHPINLAQIVALRTKDHKLLRESVTGVASGMLTTG